jgi:hypothetical protein
MNIVNSFVRPYLGGAPPWTERLPWGRRGGLPIVGVTRIMLIFSL